ncbi:tRNA pseudouridine(55) synthase TruB [Brevibacterium album]|uniref:tRNA pseudouridine(55) synthase TruB n=1 Tax=Brevibacterium album TaxID=417948 RepID=UPI0003FF069E|nr:tRNA pseudouridine(55) synthase TruB [Brevibacterium album]
MADSPPAPSGFLVLDKPAGWSSHRVVSRVRKWLGTRKVGHAGTLDPMATGVLVVGVGPATRLLTFAVGESKTYTATIRLGASTPTDDADSAPDRFAAAEAVAAVTSERLEAGLTGLRGAIMQVPSAVSAVKVDGRRAYARVRAGEEVELRARPVTISRFETTSALREAEAEDGDGRAHPVRDVDVAVDCSSGTYIRALARDLGTALGVGGHLTALRRTRVGGFTLDEALDVPPFPDPAHPEDHAARVPAPPLQEPASAAARLLPVREVSEDEARALRQGRFLPAEQLQAAPHTAAVCAGGLVAVLEPRDGQLKPKLVFPA